ncbi:hypothetical protein J6590_004347 [Homalodisca vitripennis]|nr:hypothetical protein J6590_004347 [Homalodisca vitripennis]
MSKGITVVNTVATRTRVEPNEYCDIQMDTLNLNKTPSVVAPGRSALREGSGIKTAGKRNTTELFPTTSEIRLDYQLNQQKSQSLSELERERYADRIIFYSQMTSTRAARRARPPSYKRVSLNPRKIEQNNRTNVLIGRAHRNGYCVNPVTVASSANDPVAFLRVRFRPGGSELSDTPISSFANGPRLDGSQHPAADKELFQRYKLFLLSLSTNIFTGCRRNKRPIWALLDFTRTKGVFRCTREPLPVCNYFTTRLPPTNKQKAGAAALHFYQKSGFCLRL